MRAAVGNGQWAMGNGADASTRRGDSALDGKISSFRDLVAWQRARDLGLEIYQLTSDFPQEERFGLTSQLRRGGVSVASNIAEGYGRGTHSDYARFLRIARGALFEIETQIEFAVTLGFLSTDEYKRLQGLVDATARPLSGLIRSIDQG